jgi:predicted kinase
MVKLVFFVRIAGTGKTTVAKKLAQRIQTAFLDRDTVGGRFVEAILAMNGRDKEDRDSEFYKTKLRDLEYDTVKDICVENLSLGQNVFMVSPFTEELKTKGWLDGLLTAAGLGEGEVDVKVIVVTLSDVGQQRKRIEARNTDRDEWKLRHWDKYKHRIHFVPDIAWNIPESSVHIFDNSGDLTDEKIDRLYAFIQS